MSTWLRIGGVPATEIAPHTPPTWETLADGGCGDASWAFSLTARSQHQALRRGSIVEVMCGAMPVYTGTLTEPDRTTWECHATGLSTGLRRRLALDAGAATNNVGTAITNARNEGWPGINPYPVVGIVAHEVTSPVTVGQLLDDYAEQTGQWWGVDAQRRVYMTPGPVTPQWLAAPDAAVFGVTDEDTPTRLVGRYLDSGTGLYATAYAGTPGIDEVVDLSDKEGMTLAAAEAYLNGRLQRRGDVQWVNGATLHRDQLTTQGGSPAFLPSVVGGQMIRALGVNYALATGSMVLDVVIGKTRYTAGEDTIYVEPLNTAPRNFTDVIAAA